jgi:mono/diheme cytochrome c family protein
MSALLAYLGVLGTNAANVPASTGASPAQPSSQSGEASDKDKPRAPAATEAGKPAAIPSEATTAGKQMFEERGCVGCHGPAGSGAKAPATAPLIAKVADTHVAQLLQTPNAKMKAGGMPAVDASPADLGSLVAYLRTLPVPQPGKGQPAEETIASTAPASEPTSSRAASNPSNPSRTSDRRAANQCIRRHATKPQAMLSLSRKDAPHAMGLAAKARISLPRSSESERSFPARRCQRCYTAPRARCGPEMKRKLWQSSSRHAVREEVPGAEMIVLDANILIRGVLGKRVRQLLETDTTHHNRFYAPEVAYADAAKYLQLFRTRSVSRGCTDSYGRLGEEWDRLDFPHCSRSSSTLPAVPTRGPLSTPRW